MSFNLDGAHYGSSPPARSGSGRQREAKLKAAEEKTAPKPVRQNPEPVKQIPPPRGGLQNEVGAFCHTGEHSRRKNHKSTTVPMATEQLCNAAKEKLTQAYRNTQSPQYALVAECLQAN
jgi:hypothetical protein